MLTIFIDENNNNINSRWKDAGTNDGDNAAADDDDDDDDNNNSCTNEWIGGSKIVRAELLITQHKITLSQVIMR